MCQDWRPGKTGTNKVTPMTDKLINSFQLAKRHGLDQGTTAKELTRAKLKPAMEAQYGRGVARWYELEAADAVVAAYLKRVEAGKKKPDPAGPAAPVVSLSGVERSIAVIAGDLKVAQEAIDELTRANKALGKLLFDHIQAVEKKLDRVLVDLGVKA